LVKKRRNYSALFVLEEQSSVLFGCESPAVRLIFFSFCNADTMPLFFGFSLQQIRVTATKKVFHFHQVYCTLFLLPARMYKLLKTKKDLKVD